MTKLISLRVVVACDNDALIGDVQRRLQSLISQAGSERLNGDAQDGADASCAPRVHWITADVMQGAERSTPVRRVVRKSARAPDQGELSA